MTVKQFILLGLPGTGIEDHAIALAKSWNLPHISLPPVMPNAQAPDAQAPNAQAPNAQAPNAQAPDAQALKRLRRHLEQPDAMLKGWVLEGFPSTVTQAEMLDDWLVRVGQSPAVAIYLKITTGILINRLSASLSLSVPVLRRRLSQQQAVLEPILAYYQQRNQLKAINGNRSFDEVAHSLFQLGHDPSSAARFIRDEAELDALLAKESLTVVDCMASWCGSCQQVTPLMDQLATTYGNRVNVMKIDFDANRQIHERFGVKGMPAVMFFKDGKLQETLTGVKPYQVYSATVNRFLG